MRVALLVPKVHFYAPLAIKTVLEDHDDLTYRAYLTPKINTDGSKLTGFGTLIREKGLRYLLEQGSLRVIHLALDWYESVIGRSLGQRRWPEVETILELGGVPSRDISSVQDTEFESDFQQFGPDVMFSIFFNQIVPRSIFELPSLGSYNLHPGRLPEYRGHSPVFYQLLRETDQAGCALHELTSELDAGPVYGQKRVTVSETDSVHSLYGRLASVGGDLISELLHEFRSTGEIQTRAQDDEKTGEYSDFTREELSRFRQNRSWWRFRDLLN